MSIGEMDSFRRSTRVRSFARLFVLWLATLSGGAQAADLIKTVTFNVLAPSWASPAYYPAACAGDLDPAVRRLRAVAVMTSQMPDADFFMLQETQVDQDRYFAQGLGSSYTYFPVYHRDDYWASWITADPPFARNGVALAVNKNKYDRCTFVDLPLSDDGNHAAAATCRHKTLNRWVRVAAVHLDSDYGGRRGKEARALGEWFANGSGDTIDIIAGDFNADTNSGVVQQRIMNQGFIDVLRAAGVAENTHPWTSSYNNNSNYGNIDHVVGRGARLLFSGGRVFDSGLWSLYPVLNGNGEPNESARICANLQLTGSDHFPVLGVITAQP